MTDPVPSHNNGSATPGDGRVCPCALFDLDTPDDPYGSLAWANGEPMPDETRPASPHGEQSAVQYRVVCPDGMVTWRRGPSSLGKVMTDYTEACDLRAARDAERGTTGSLHLNCGPHRVEERTVTYGEWH